MMLKIVSTNDLMLEDLMKKYQDIALWHYEAIINWWRCEEWRYTCWSSLVCLLNLGAQYDCTTKNILTYSLNMDEFYRVSQCKSAKDMLDVFEVTYMKELMMWKELGNMHWYKSMRCSRCNKVNP